MPTDFYYSLEYLQHEDEELTFPVLSYLSGARPDQARAFAQVVAKLSEERRRHVIQMLVDQTEESYMVDFHRLLRSVLHQDDPVVRRLAAKGLWEDGGSDLVPLFCHMLTHDPDTLVRAQIAASLGRFVWAYQMAEISDRLGRQVLDALKAVVDAAEDDLEVVRRAIEALGFENDDSVSRVIEDAYHHENHLMRVSAVFAMGRSADSAWRNYLLTELDSAQADMRFEAVRACGEVGLKAAVMRLVELIDDPDDAVRHQAILSLGKIGGARARNVLEELADEEDETIAKVVEAAINELDFAEMTFDMMSIDADDAEEMDLEWSDSLQMLAPNQDDEDVDDEDDGMMSETDLSDDDWNDDDDPLEII